MKNGSAIVRSISGIEVNQRSIDGMDALQDIHHRNQGFLKMVRMSEISLRECSKVADGYLRALDLVLCGHDRPEVHLEKFLGSEKCRSFLSEFTPSDPAIKLVGAEVYLHPEIARPLSIWLNIPLATEMRCLLEEPCLTMTDALLGNSLIRSLRPNLKNLSTTRRLDQFVYLIETADKQFLKIGTTKNPEKRLIILRSSNPVELNILFSIKGTEVLERELFAEFADVRVRGEWFKYSKRIITKFKSIQKLQSMEDAT